MWRYPFTKTNTARSHGYSPVTPFRLRSFATSIRLDPDLAAFLESQPEIRDLSLRGIPAYTSNPFTLPPSALPHLESFRSIHVDQDTLGEVIATRPVQGISLSLFSEHGYRALEVLARTSTHVRRLTILIVDASAPSQLFPQFAAHLEALHVVALVQKYDLDPGRLHSLAGDSRIYDGASRSGPSEDDRPATQHDVRLPPGVKVKGKQRTLTRSVSPPAQSDMWCDSPVARHEPMGSPEILTAPTDSPLSENPERSTTAISRPLCSFRGSRPSLHQGPESNSGGSLSHHSRSLMGTPTAPTTNAPLFPLGPSFH
ncbi:hypothetical protein BC826DRAFT_119904 [Russula brevipes]|nr:hypothetical protein BC826DRAFT_119904 [Russula brevipes]